MRDDVQKLFYKFKGIANDVVGDVANFSTDKPVLYFGCVFFVAFVLGLVAGA